MVLHAKNERSWIVNRQVIQKAPLGGLFGLKKHQNGDFHIKNPQIGNYLQITKLLAKNERFWTIWQFPGQKKPIFGQIMILW